MRILDRINAKSAGVISSEFVILNLRAMTQLTSEIEKELGDYVTDREISSLLGMRVLVDLYQSDDFILATKCE